MLPNVQASRSEPSRTRGLIPTTRACILIATLSAASAARADFINGGFEQTAGATVDQPFPGWTVEYRRVHQPAWSQTLPGGHPPGLRVPNWSFNTLSFSALCGANSAQINDLIGGSHATRIFQEVTLGPADFDSCGTATVTVCWFGVFHHPGGGIFSSHSTSEQPFFAFKIIRTNASAPGSPFEVVSNAYASNSATQPNSGWFAAPGDGPDGHGKVYYRAKCEVIPLHDARVGDRIFVEMEVRDCTKGGHGAMAFLDCASITPGTPGGLSNLFPANTFWSTAITSQVDHHEGDFNGDGRSDLIDYRPSGALRVLESTGASFLAPVNAVTGLPTGITRIHTGDFDGDGCTDVVAWDGSALRFIWANAATPGLDFDPVHSVIGLPGGVGAGGRFWIGDFNGDGLDDIVRDTGAQIQVVPASGIRAFPIQLPSSWQSSGSLKGGFHVGDFNADGKADLMQSLATGLHFLTSTGSAFSPLTQWRTEGPRPFGWIVGNFDCDRASELVEWKPNNYPFLPPIVGVLSILNIVPPPHNLTGGLVAASSALFGIQQGPFVVGDYDGNGQDDIAHIYRNVGVGVVRACAPMCPCLYVSVSAACDYPDRSSRVLTLNIENHTGQPIDSVSVTPAGPFGVSPTLVALSPPLANRRARTITVIATGLPPNAQRCVNVESIRGGSVTCQTTACFQTGVCDCMDILGQLPYCNPDGSGTLCFPLGVRNAGASTARFIRLSPAAMFVPSLIPVNIAPGATYTSTGCALTIIQNGTYVLNFTVELLDENLNLLCDETIGLDLPACDINGECCVPGVGLLTKTAIGCGLLGGTWTPPGVSQYCPQGATGGAAQLRILVPRSNSYVTISEEQRTYIAHRTGSGSPAADFATNPAAEIRWPLDPIDPRGTPGEGHIMHLSGEQGGSFAPIADFSILRAAAQPVAGFDFTMAGAGGITILSKIESPNPPIDLPQPTASVSMEATPARVRAVVSDIPGTTHGFILSFNQPTLVAVEPGDPFLATELSILATGAPAVASLTGVGFRGVNSPVIGLGLIEVINGPCLGDLTGDCRISQADVDAFNEASMSGAHGEGDVNGDGAADINDLFIIFASIGLTCPCGEPAPPPCPGDSNADGDVNFADITSTLTHFNTDYGGMTGLGDANLSGTVNFADISAVLTDWGTICP